MAEHQGFLKMHWCNLPLQQVDHAVHFLRELNASPDFSDLLDQRITLFLESRNSTKPISADLYNLHPDTRERIAQLLISTLQPMPIEDAVERLTKDGGWTPSDIIYLAKTTSDEFYEFLTSSQTPYLLNTIKVLRERLLGSEGGTPILHQLDAALLRLASRSPLDARRVLQTDVALPKTPGESNV